MCADASHDGFDAAKLGEAAGLDIQMRPALERGETIAQLGVVATAQDDGRIQMFRGGADGCGVAKARDGYQQRAPATHCDSDGAKCLGINAPALFAGEKADSYGTRGEDSLQFHGPIQILDWIDGRYWVELDTVAVPRGRQHLIVGDLMAMAACGDQ